MGEPEKILNVGVLPWDQPGRPRAEAVRAAGERDREDQGCRGPAPTSRRPGWATRGASTRARLVGELTWLHDEARAQGAGATCRRGGRSRMERASWGWSESFKRHRRGLLKGRDRRKGDEEAMLSCSKAGRRRRRR